MKKLNILFKQLPLIILFGCFSLNGFSETYNISSGDGYQLKTALNNAIAGEI